MKAKAIWAVAAVVLATAGMAQADITIETVPVGNPGNTGELSGTGAGGYGPDRICGAVDYKYRIGKYEVTAGQYCAFLNAKAKTDPYGLYNTDMDTFWGCNIKRIGSSDSYAYTVAADWANRPVNYVSWGDSVRFTNWLTNGQGNGSTETGAYNLNGAMTDAELMAVVAPSAAQRATWSTGVKPYFLLTSEDEWYKAAYHDKNAGLAATYFNYPTSSNSVPSHHLVVPTDPGNNATYTDTGVPVFTGFTIGGPYYRTEVGAHENSDSPYGTFDQGGNVDEWNDAVIGGPYRGFRGGSFFSDEANLRASKRYFIIPTPEDSALGFRIVVVPEPATLSLLALGAVAILRRRRNVRE